MKSFVQYYRLSDVEVAGIRDPRILELMRQSEVLANELNTALLNRNIVGIKVAIVKFKELIRHANILNTELFLDL